MSDMLLEIRVGRLNHLLVHIQLAEDLRRIEKVLVVEYSIHVSRVAGSPKVLWTHFLPLKANSGRFSTNASQ